MSVYSMLFNVTGYEEGPRRDNPEPRPEQPYTLDFSVDTLEPGWLRVSVSGGEEVGEGMLVISPAQVVELHAALERTVAVRDARARRPSPTREDG